MRFDRVSLFVLLAASLAVIVVWFRSRSWWLDALVLVAVTLTFALLALVMLG